MPSHAIVLAVFFASGFSALVYQVLWVEMFGKVFGITTFAASAVTDDRPLNEYFGLLRTADMWRLLPSETAAYRPGL